MKLSAVIVAVWWLRIWVFSIQVPGSNAGEFFFSTFFMHLLTPQLLFYVQLLGFYFLTL